MGEKYIFEMYGLNKYYGQKHILKDINLCFFPGAKIGIVGPNGAGKSTVLRVMAGIDDDFQGKADLTPGFRVGFVPQEPQLDEDATVRANLETALAEVMKLREEFDEVTAKMGEELSDDEMDKVMNRMAELQDQIDACEGWEIERRLEKAADALVLPPDDAIVKNLSGGERRRVALCKALLEQPDLLLLDEPTNHLDAETVEWMEQALVDYPGTVIIVTHDRYFLDKITKWILELEGGHGIPFEGNYSGWLQQKIERLIQEEKKDSPRRKAMENELSWLKLSSRDRLELSRDRVQDYERTLAREEAASKNSGFETLQINPGPRLGEKVVEFKDVAKGFGDRTLFKDLSFSLPRGAIVGVNGPNGVGKTTLFQMIMGHEQPDSGTIDIGETVEAAYGEQERGDLPNDATVFEAISEGETDVMIGGRPIPARAYTGRFGFKGSDQEKRVGDLSGGERNRLQLALLIKKGGNLLLLDEPTNDLDVATLRLLEEALLNFSGCAMVISHDRCFLDRVCTHLLVFEGEDKVRWFEGNFEAYEEKRREELGDKALTNRRARYRGI